jgi:hypothetical protein
VSPLKQQLVAHWHAFKNPLINDVLINLGEIEKALPPISPEEEAAISKLLESCATVQVNKVDEMEFINLLNQLPAAYMLYVVHKMQTLNSDLVMRLINYAQKHRATNPEVALFYQRNMVFEKSQLLGRIFSNTRMQAVLKVL